MIFKERRVVREKVLSRKGGLAVSGMKVRTGFQKYSFVVMFSLEILAF